MKTLLLALLLTFSAHVQAAKIAQVATDHDVYENGAKSLLTVLLSTKPSNPNFEFDVVTSLNTAGQTVDRSTDYVFYSLTDSLTTGDYEWNTNIVLQDAHYAHDLKASLVYFAQEIAHINARLESETDPDTIHDLQVRKAKYEDMQSAAQVQLNSIRTVVETHTNSITVQ